MLKTVYFISGLGADNRAFEAMDLSFCKAVPLEWMTPAKNEDISAYAARFLAYITDPEPIIVGLSFGGIMAMEIARHISFKKVILISSASNYREIPFYFRMMKWFPLHRWIGVERIKKLNGLAYRLMGISKRSDKVIFMQMLNETDNDFMDWAIEQIIHWKNSEIPANTIHIHGTHDILLPHLFVQADYSIRRGKHLMPMIEPERMSKMLRDLL